LTQRIRLGLIGSNISRSLAPAFHVEAGARMGLDVTYDLLAQPDLDVDQLAAVIGEVRSQGFVGVNVTYPFKQAALDLVDRAGPGVNAIGAVNTVVFRPEHVISGFNTDHSGLQRRWRQQMGAKSPETVAVIGAGGVGRAAAFAFAGLGAEEIRVSDVDTGRAEKLVHDLARSYPGVTVNRASQESAIRSATGIFNGTPLGMHFSPGTPVSLDAIGGQQWLFDAVYTPVRTPLVERGLEVGLRVFDGFELFLGQAVDAFQHFTGIDLPDEVAAEVEVEMRALLPIN
jgi:shikimate dehydrogenase